MNQFNLQFSLIMKDDIQEVFTSEFSWKKIITDWIAFPAMKFSGL